MVVALNFQRLDAKFNPNECNIFLQIDLLDNLPGEEVYGPRLGGGGILPGSETKD